MTAEEPETSAIPAQDPARAEEDLWLTYLNYDSSIKQAVRRLGALSSQNVDEFRALLLKGRDRSRVKDYEADTIRRLQGEAFVGDEALQQTLIVLNAEDPRLGEAFKRHVAAAGKPADIDQAVAAIRAQLASPGRPAPATMVAALADGPSSSRPMVPPPSRIAEAQDIPRGAWTKPVAVMAAVLVVGAVALVVAAPDLVRNNIAKLSGFQATSVPLRPAASEDRPAVGEAAPAEVAVAGPPKVAEPAPPVLAAAPVPSPVQTAPPADMAGPVSSAPASAPPVSAAPNPAAVLPEVAPPEPNAPLMETPVAGAYYRAVRGDMLSVIALKAYGDVSKFRLIQAANPSVRNTPDLVYVDQTLFIPMPPRP